MRRACRRCARCASATLCGRGAVGCTRPMPSRRTEYRQRKLVLVSIVVYAHRPVDLQTLRSRIGVGARVPDAAVHESGSGLGCVKTPKLNLRIEISSRLHQFDKQKTLATLSGEDNRENNSAPSSRADVFTQPRPKPAVRRNAAIR